MTSTVSSTCSSSTNGTTNNNNNNNKAGPVAETSPLVSAAAAAHSSSCCSMPLASFASSSVAVPPVPQWQEFAFASIAPTLAAPMTNPFAVAKTQLQVQTSSGGRGGPPYRGMVGFFRHALLTSTDGVQTLQRGLVPVMMREASKNLFRIGLYRPILGWIHPPHHQHQEQHQRGHPSTSTAATTAPVWKRMVAGAASGAVGAVVCNPFEIVRVRVQAQDVRAAGAHHGARRGYRTVSEITSQIYFTEGGLRGFYRAGSVSVVLGMVITSVNLTSYTMLHEYAVHALGMVDGPTTDVPCALASGFLAALAVNPVDVVRTRLMAQPSVVYRNAIHAASTILSTEGPAAFLRGFIPSFLRIGPHFVLSFVLLEQMRRWAKSYNADRARDEFLQGVFEDMDVDGNATIDRSELVEAVRVAYCNLGGRGSSAEEEAEELSKQIFDVADVDGNGTIDLNEFLYAARLRKLDDLLRARYLLSIFRTMDTNGDGTIDEAELMEAFRGMRAGPPDPSEVPAEEEAERSSALFERQLRRDVARVMDEVDGDGDGDGTIDFAEFCSALDSMDTLEGKRLMQDLVRGAGFAVG